MSSGNAFPETLPEQEETSSDSVQESSGAASPDTLTVSGSDSSVDVTVPSDGSTFGTSEDLTQLYTFLETIVASGAQREKQMEVCISLICFFLVALISYALYKFLRWFF